MTTIRTHLLIVSLFLCGLAFSQEGNNNSSGETPDVESGRTELTKALSFDSEIQLDLSTLHSTPRFGLFEEQIELYHSTDFKKYYVAPFLIPNWNQYKEQLDQAIEKSLTVVKDSTGTSMDTIIDLSYQASIEFEIRLWGERLENAVVEAIGKTNINQAVVHSLPYAFYEISAERRNGNRVNVYTSVEVETIINSSSRSVMKTSIPDIIQARISLRLDDLISIYNNRHKKSTLIGHLYSSGYSLQQNAASVQLRSLLTTSAKQKLFGKETAQFKVKSKSTSAGLDLSFNKKAFSASAGASRVDSESEVFAQRYVSRKYLSDLLENSSSTLSIGVTGDRKFNDSILPKLIDNWLARLDVVTAQLKVLKDRQIQISFDQIKYATAEIPKNSVEQTPSSKRDSKRGATKKGKDGKDEASIGLNASSELSNTFKAGGFNVPTDVDLYLVNEAELEEIIDFDVISSIRSEEVGLYVRQFSNPCRYIASLPTDSIWWPEFDEGLSILTGKSRIKKKVTPIAKPENQTIFIVGDRRGMDARGRQGWGLYK